MRRSYIGSGVNLVQKPDLASLWTADKSEKYASDQPWLPNRIHDL